jgi:hypothetical protein
MGIAFHPTTGLQGVFRVRSDEAESFTVGRIDAAMGSKIVTDQRHVYPTSDMLFCGSQDEAATLAIHLNDLAKSFCRFPAAVPTHCADLLRAVHTRGASRGSCRPMD